jgi:hypothetical protein
MSPAAWNRVRRHLDGFWQRQKAREQRRVEQQRKYAGKTLPIWRPTRRPLSPDRNACGQRTPQERVEIRRAG